MARVQFPALLDTGTPLHTVWKATLGHRLQLWLCLNAAGQPYKLAMLQNADC